MTALLAIAIEDDVELYYESLGPKSGPPAYSARPIPEGQDYLECVRRAIKELVRATLRHWLSEQTTADAGDFFNDIEAVVLSVPGVVEENRSLKQIPLWQSVPYDAAYNKVNGFDFPEELGAIARALVEEEGAHWRQTELARFQRTVFAVNDATACAAFECSQRPAHTSRADAVYVKLHNGVNVGLVGERDGALVVPRVHGEAGHGFPIKHRIDVECNFEGVCPFHSSCFEGMLAAHSLTVRARTLQSRVFEVWRQYMTTLEDERIVGQHLDNAISRYAVGANGIAPSGNGEGVELVAYYVSQLIYQLILNPPVPGQIVLGGRLVSGDVIRGIRANIPKWSKGYPHRRELSPEKIRDYIVPGVAGDERVSVEASGALVIALSRLGMSYNKRIVERQ